jgi:hypothetical protein
MTSINEKTCGHCQLFTPIAKDNIELKSVDPDILLLQIVHNISPGKGIRNCSAFGLVTAKSPCVRKSEFKQK